MSEPTDRWVSAEQVGTVTVARLLPRTVADQPVIQGVRQELFKLAETPQGGQLLIDFGEVTQFGSAFLAVLLELNRKFKTSGGRLAICWLNPHLRQVFEVTRLDQTLNIYEDEESALDSF
jgi:anti-anti-sigma factor